MKKDVPVIFTETQRFTQVWMWFFVGGIAALAWIGFIWQIILGETMGNQPAPDWMMYIILPAFGIAFPWFMLSCRLHVWVRTDGLFYRFAPFHRKPHHIEFPLISSYEVVTYRPILDYGGWGIRYGFNGKAYNVRGNRGLQIQLLHGERILFGSQKPEAFKEALDTAKA